MKLISTFTLLLLSSLMLAQNPRFLDEDEPLIESASVAKDGSGNYHFYYSFNLSNKTSSMSLDNNPVIERIHFYEFGASSSFTDKRPKSTSNEIKAEFVINERLFDSYIQVQYSIEWKVNNEQGTRLSKNSSKKTLRVSFDDDPTIAIDLHVDGLYYSDDNSIIPMAKIKTNADGTAIRGLSLHDQPNKNSTVVAKYEDTGIRINSNKYTEIKLTPQVNYLQEGKTYYLFGEFKRDNITGTFPIPTKNTNNFRLYKIEYPIVKSYMGSKTFTVTGQAPLDIILDVTSSCTFVTARIEMGENGFREYKLEPVQPKEDNRWNLKIFGDDKIPFGNWPINFTGMGKSGRAMKKTTFTYSKKQITRETIEVDYNKETDEFDAIATFDAETNEDVFLMLDNKPVSMVKDANNPKNYKISFKYSDANLKKIANEIKQSSNNSKKIKITTRIGKHTDHSYLIKNALVIDISKIESKKKKDIKDYLAYIGLTEDDMNSLVDSISAEMKKDKSKQNWGANVWSDAVKLAPKLLPIIIAAI